MLPVFTSFLQGAFIKGSVVDMVSLQPIKDVTITIESTKQIVHTNEIGAFVFSGKVPLGEQILVLSKVGYVTKRYPIIVNENETVSIFDMTLERVVPEIEELFTISLSDDELDSDASESDNISGLLASSLDVFQRTVAFEFSPSFFKMRGLESNNSTVLINGIKMNKFYTGSPQWSNWGGLNDVMRSRELSTGLLPSSYNFGGILGSVNITMRPSQVKSGARLTYSSSNRSYTNRLMATYSSGLQKSGWAYMVSVSRRWGDEGYQDGTSYNANSFFASVESVINENHSLGITGIFTPNRRGKSSPNTQEVYNLKGTKYNEYWGWQQGEKRNSRIKEVAEPVIMLNHHWHLNNKTILNTNIAYQFGNIGSSRLDYNGNDLVNGLPEGGGVNPSPAYYQKLPSYFERNFSEDLEFAYGAQKQFLKYGQINWGHLYEANILNASKGGNAIYALYEDRVDDKLLTLNTILNWELSDHTICNAAFNYRNLKSENFAEVLDLFGASSYLDIDGFATNIDDAQNDLLNPNRVVKEGDRFKYNFNFLAREMEVFVQTQFRYTKIDFYMGARINNTQHQRDGVYKNGGFPDYSFGKGKTLSFTGLGVKGGLTYKPISKHIIDVNAGYITRPPTLQNTYSNARENHSIVPNISEEKIATVDASYILRLPFVKAKFTGYYTKITNANAISFFFADGIGGDNAVFVQEILQGIETNHLGGELGIEAQVTQTIKLKGVASVGQFTYANNPNLFLTTEANDASKEAGFTEGFKDFGKAYLKNYKLAAGPQSAYSFGLEYRDPEYWWFGVAANMFTNTYVDVSPLTRSSNFTTDFDGNPFNDYDEELAAELLKQERFDDYLVVNLVGGKSWKVGSKYIGFFASINNVLDKVYKTGGFEQGRNANFRQLRDDKALETPVFDSKYWYGRGITYFMNLYVRF
ncbi:carboxypeptidase-like regulatory domain-containing protein [Snuella lapsa]|uniref:Carboxypeptidase-like regulatory domain-containing protein n=1 Tax=Snuella lapsa TaxID=870481 RepID=A0ABP6WYZ6_9FLAO